MCSFSPVDLFCLLKRQRPMAGIQDADRVNGSGDSPLWGYCAACGNSKFDPTRELTDRNQQRQRLKYLFNQYFVKVHLQRQD